MKKSIFAIFAHPDDEAFGPSGTLLMEAQAGNDVHLILLTAGEAGMNPDAHDDLAEVRLKEWRAAAKLIGASSTTYLGYRDGRLCNEDLIEIGKKLIGVITKKLIGTGDDCQVEMMSADLTGISGHLDHIVAARAACYAFYKLKSNDDRLTRTRLACLPFTHLDKPNVDWLFMEAGRKPEEIDETIDARTLQPEIIEIMRTHQTQREDYQRHIDRGLDNIGLNYFVVLT